MLRAIRIIVTGIVQGVGFRPSIYRIAVKSGVKGYVRNLGGSEVEIYIEGDRDAIDKFMGLLKTDLPPVALIHNIDVFDVEPIGYDDFEILPSMKRSVKRSIVPPDFSVCDDCMKEVYDPRSRWYRYPFNSCAYCGPRYSIMQDIPYDRDKTSMVDFPLCRECSEDYGDPGNIRRFHAQGISCPECGPKVWLVDNAGDVIECKDPIREASKLINEGYILSVKGIGGFHIAALASSDDVVLKLRRRKDRPEKPFAIMAKDIETLNKLVYLNEEAERILLSPQHPILLLNKKEDCPASKYIAPGLAHLGVFLPYTPLHHLLLDGVRDKYAIMTSGNPKGEPMCIKNTEALKKLRNIVDYHLLHNRRIVNRVDDSVLRFTYDSITMLRRGRGYAPYWILLRQELVRDVVSFGAMLQNAGGVGFENKAVLTQYIGDCDDFRTLLDLKIYMRRLVKLYRVSESKAIVAVDTHPTYPTKRLAKEWSEKNGVPLVEIQHHWAHIASVMAEHGIDDETIGIAIDGAGYGIDGNVWGGEIIKASPYEFRRVGHIEYIPMPGGDLATTYPVRILIGILSRIMGEDEVITLIEKYKLMERSGRSDKEVPLIMRQIRSGSLLTSSLGRVLDAASCLLGFAYVRTYEGEPAMKLEAAARPGRQYLYAKTVEKNGEFVIKISDMFEDILELMEEGVDKGILAYNVQWALGNALAEGALKYVDNFVAVSGGAAVNTIIMKAIKSRCREEGVDVICNKSVPPGDGGVALGQIYIAGLKGDF